MGHKNGCPFDGVLLVVNLVSRLTKANHRTFLQLKAAVLDELGQLEVNRLALHCDMLKGSRSYFQRTGFAHKPLLLITNFPAPIFSLMSHTKPEMNRFTGRDLLLV